MGVPPPLWLGLAGLFLCSGGGPGPRAVDAVSLQRRPQRQHAAAVPPTNTDLVIPDPPSPASSLAETAAHTQSTTALFMYEGFTNGVTGHVKASFSTMGEVLHMTPEEQAAQQWFPVQDTSSPLFLQGYTEWTSTSQGFRFRSSGQEAVSCIAVNSKRSKNKEDHKKHHQHKGKYSGHHKRFTTSSFDDEADEALIMSFDCGSSTDSSFLQGHSTVASLLEMDGTVSEEESANMFWIPAPNPSNTPPATTPYGWGKQDWMDGWKYPYYAITPGGYIGCQQLTADRMCSVSPTIYRRLYPTAEGEWQKPKYFDPDTFEESQWSIAAREEKAAHERHTYHPPKPKFPARVDYSYQYSHGYTPADTIPAADANTPDEPGSTRCLGCGETEVPGPMQQAVMASPGGAGQPPMMFPGAMMPGQPPMMPGQPPMMPGQPPMMMGPGMVQTGVTPGASSPMEAMQQPIAGPGGSPLNPPGIPPGMAESREGGFPAGGIPGSMPDDQPFPYPYPLANGLPVVQQQAMLPHAFESGLMPPSILQGRDPASRPKNVAHGDRFHLPVVPADPLYDLVLNNRRHEQENSIWNFEKFHHHFAKAK